MYRRLFSMGTSSQSCSHVISLVNLGVIDSLHYGAMILKSWCGPHVCEDTMQMLMRLVLMMHVSMTRLPTKWVSDRDGNPWVEKGCMRGESHSPTKIPSALLVAIIWLQHTRCPRSRCGTFGYDTTTLPNIREIEYEYWNPSCGYTLVRPWFPHAYSQGDICFNSTCCEQDQEK
jgi:hypothetical protein